MNEWVCVRGERRVVCVCEWCGVWCVCVMCVSCARERERVCGVWNE